MASPAADFVALTTEKRTLNQYWYSVRTIQVLAAEVEDVLRKGGTVACVSTPSVFFAVRRGECDRDDDGDHAGHLSGRMFLLDLDDQWAESIGPAWIRFDYREPLALPAPLAGAFDMCIIDPPFVTEDVWRLYGEAARALMKPPSEVGGVGRSVGDVCVRLDCIALRFNMVCLAIHDISLRLSRTSRPLASF